MHCSLRDFLTGPASVMTDRVENKLGRRAEDPRVGTGGVALEEISPSTRRLIELERTVDDCCSTRGGGELIRGEPEYE